MNYIHPSTITKPISDLSTFTVPSYLARNKAFVHLYFNKYNPSTGVIESH